VSPIEFILRAVGVALLAWLAVVLYRATPSNFRTRSAVGLAASVAAFLITSMPGAQRLLGPLIYPLTALCSTHPVWFWMFSSALFADRPMLRGRHVIALAAMAIAGVVYQSALPTVSEAPTAEIQMLGVGFGLATLMFAALAPLAVTLGARTDLDARRRRIRRWFVPAVSLYVAAIAATQSIVLLRGQTTPHSLVLLNLLAIDSIAALAVASFLRVQVVNWLNVTETRAQVALTRQEQKVLNVLKRRFVAERMYAEASCSIVELARAFGTQEHVLRRVINQGLGYRNFNDFLHCHRLKEAAARLRDPEQQRIPVLTIALEAGFGSIGPFNRAFRERFGTTPTEYRRSPTSSDDAFDAPLLPQRHSPANR
jgi:AraC-like DNA-binding protein